MNPPPYESKYKYYGDEWLVFHDTLASLTDRESIFIELLYKPGLIGIRELAYKTGGKEAYLNGIKCTIEMNREEDVSKHPDILKKYNIEVLPTSKKDDKDSSMYG